VKKLLFITILFLAVQVHGQSTDCPSDKVCLDHATANKLLDTVNQLIAAKDVIVKMTSDNVILSAQRVIDDYKKLDEINGMMVLKYKDAMNLYESVVKLQQGVIERLTAQLNKPKSAWQKAVQIAEKVVVLLAGIAIGGL